MIKSLRSVEWPTLVLIAACYVVWALATTALAEMSVIAAIGTTALAIAFHGSLTHEIIHGHPFRNKTLNHALVFPTLTLVIPLARFRDTHMAHHMDAELTDPYDDPESNYFDPKVWKRLPRVAQRALNANNTLAGRLILGPLISQIAFLTTDYRAARAGDARVISGWLWHIPQAGIVSWWLLSVGSMPLWAYGLAIYGGISILKIRTFLEHQAHERASGRTVIIEDRGPLAFMFLNNNFHVVHHMHPDLPWYSLPKRYFENSERYLARNGGYVYRSYRAIFQQYFLRRKDPVPHPLRDPQV